MLKKKIIYLISGIIIIVVIGTIVYLVWPKNKPVENETETKSQLEEKVKELKSQLTQIRNELNKPENLTKKIKYSTQLTEIENKLKNLSQQNNQEQTIQKLEQNIKTISQELKISEKPNDPEPDPDPDKPEENSNCPYLNEVNLTTSKPQKLPISNEELVQWREIPRSYIVSLWKKGYHWNDVLQLWEWKIPELEVPDLKTEKRVGVINELGVIHNPDKLNRSIPEAERQKLDNHAGLASNLLVIMRKVSGSVPIINIDKKGQVAIPGYKKNVIHYTKKIVNLFLEQEKISPADYQICVLNSLGAENFDREEWVSFGKSFGKSAGSAVYLALLSAYHQKPISHSVAATGALSLSTKITKKGKINGQEFIIQPGTNQPIRGLKWKTQAATEKGVNHLVLSKFQLSPNLLSEWGSEKKKKSLSENYQEVVPAEIKSKIKEIHWTENIQDLRDLVLGNKLS